MRTGVAIGGRFRLVHWDRHHRLAWDVALRNGVTVQGADYLNGAAFGGLAQVATWYAGLIDGASVPMLFPADRNDLHAGFTEYMGVAGRPAWNKTAASSGYISSVSSSVFSVTRNGSVFGAFLSSRSPVGDLSASGVLYSTAAALAALPVTTGGTVALQYQVQAQPIS